MFHHMPFSLSASMAAFALAASLSPGPVNLMALNIGLKWGLRPALHHVTGATCGFTLLLLLIGLGLRPLTQWTPLMTAIRWGGVAFLLYLAWRLARDDGRLQCETRGSRGSFATGALMQWLNPKAWVASAAGMGAYTAGDLALVGHFAAIFFVVCYLSVASWAVMGTVLHRHLPDRKQARWLNRGMALLLLASAVTLGRMTFGDSGMG